MDVRQYIAIRQLSPLVNPPDDGLVCVFTAYLDASGKDGVVGLASYIATQTSWARLERHWLGILAHNRMERGVHMNDLYGRRKAFAGKDQVQALSAASDFVSYLAGLHDWSYRRYSCVVVRSDYEKAQRDILALREKPIHAFCVDRCVGRFFSPRFKEPNDPDANIEILFDGNEEFFEHLHRVWKVEKNESWSWASRVVSVGEVNNKDNLVIPMQAVDVLAWVARRYRTLGDHEDWHEALCGGERAQTNCHDFFDYGALVAKYGAAASEPQERDGGQR